MKDEKEQNLLDFIPAHNIDWEINPDNKLIVLKKPKFENNFLKQHLLPRLSNPNFTIKLDEYGSKVWQNIDGQRNVLEIADQLKTLYGESVEPVYERVGKFIISLEKNKFIIYKH